MRRTLLNSVAVAALSISVAGAWAQERQQERRQEGAPAAQSEGQRGNAPSRENRGEERSQQGQRASEGAGREGAGRNASERGQERGERAQPSTAQQGREQGREQNAQQQNERERDQQQQQQQRTNAQQNERERNQNQQLNQQQGQQRNQEQQRTTTGQDNRQPQGQPSTPSSQSTQSSQDRNSGSSSTQGAQQQGADRNRDNAAASTSTNADRSGRSQTNVQVRGEFNIDQQAATRVHDRLIRESDARSNDININIDVGRNLPNNVRLRPVPRDIVEINPRYRDYEYTIVRDEIVIVEPRTKKVVQIISSGSGRRGQSHMVRLDNRQRDLVRRDIMRTRTGSARRDQDVTFELREGVEIPDRVTLQTFPQEVWREIPDLREVRYVIVRDEIVLVDPDTREIIEIIR